MLRNHLDGRRIAPEQCVFRLVARGPILEEAKDKNTHFQRRDVIGALEKKLAESLLAAGYDAMNTVHCNKPLDEALYDEVRAAFAPEFPGL
ncbi:MAG TPA: hypothetical protein VGP18_11095 [Solirubrobacteraceae bacterium]|jgi:hypothetical protein|nr:hypothetical protein [Solirubrobacteraceae bacterium]